MQNNQAAWAVVLATCVPLLATAQAAKPKPAPQLSYQSAFAGYKPYKDVPLANWRELNDTVAGAPGHTGHAMKAMETPVAPATPASAAIPTKPMPMHEGHPKPGGQR
ncbi:hypothetical protein [Rhizobacter sp. Root1221]|uniref:hypothetical protein n=1 Tax=Rhizobacter sp. Root1221 TaxID=1736433 RepID=UPI000A405185|nr:hypothetical protein [Rhizobacter sp. Root1221]